MGLFGDLFDFNGDGKINLLDLVRLKRFLAGINVPLGTNEFPQTQTLQVSYQPAYLENKSIVS